MTAMPVKDHILRDVVNSLRDVAIEFHDTAQLRERLRHALGPLINQGNGLQSEKAAQAQGDEAITISTHWLNPRAFMPTMPASTIRAVRPVGWIVMDAGFDVHFGPDLADLLKVVGDDNVVAMHECFVGTM